MLRLHCQVTDTPQYSGVALNLLIAIAERGNPASKEANDRNAEQKMTFVDDTKEFQDSSMPVPHDSIWEK